MPAKRKVGRPLLEYKPAVADALCALICTTRKSLRTLCKEDGMPSVQTVLKWLRLNPDFAAQYVISKQEQAEMMAEDILEIADDGTNDTYTTDEGQKRVDTDVIQRSKLRIDTRKWLASKLLPKKYGDSYDVTSGGEVIQQTVPVITFNLPPMLVSRRGATHTPN